MSHGQIVKEYGAPDREVSDGEDGYILVYETYHTSSHIDDMGFVNHSGVISGLTTLSCDPRNT